MAPATKPTIILVHGAWHGSCCWRYQTPALEALGYTVETVDLPCISGTVGTTQFDDAAHVRSAVEAQLSAGKRVVILAHSYAGPIASAAIKGLPGKDQDQKKRRRRKRRRTRQRTGANRSVRLSLSRRHGPRRSLPRRWRPALRDAGRAQRGFLRPQGPAQLVFRPGCAGRSSRLGGVAAPAAEYGC